MAEPRDEPPLPPLGAELENMDLHMLREWLDGSISDAESAGSDNELNDDSLQALLLRSPFGLPPSAAVGSPAPSTASSSNTETPSRRMTASSSSAVAGKRPRDDEQQQGKRRAWPSQREELVFLRTEVCTLENELRELKAASRRQFSAASAPLARFSSAGADGAIVVCNVPGSLWEQVANRQLDEKVRAEVENRKLRDMVDAQVRLAKRLQQLLRKRQVGDRRIFEGEGGNDDADGTCCLSAGLRRARGEEAQVRNGREARGVQDLLVPDSDHPGSVPADRRVLPATGDQQHGRGGQRCEHEARGRRAARGDEGVQAPAVRLSRRERRGVALSQVRGHDDAQLVRNGS